jgi:UDP-N-acetylmuramate dehydrogenase
VTGRPGRDVSLRQWNTFGVPSVADWAAVVADEQELDAVLSFCADSKQPLTILGGGSNVVLRARLPGCALQFAGRRVLHEAAAGHHVLVTAEAGMPWHDLVRYCLGQGYYGIENLALIPGTVGAAPIQNIGAYGVELDQHFVSLSAVDLSDGRRRELDGRACGFGYRDSIFKGAFAGRYLITSVTLALSREPRVMDHYPGVATELRRMGGTASPVRIAEAICRLRRSKLPDPRRVGNAGSFFKNPVVDSLQFQELRRQLPDLPHFDSAQGTKVPAAALIEACGFKGARMGRVGVWHRHALVLVNLGGATGKDLLGAATTIADAVEDRFGLRLDIEPQVLGTDS